MALPYSSTGASKRRRCLIPQPFKSPSGLYYFRMRVLNELRLILGHEFKRSLNTRDPAEAKTRYAEKLIASQQAFATARAQLDGQDFLTDRDIEQLAARWNRGESERMDAHSSYGDWLVHGETVEVEQGTGNREQGTGNRLHFLPIVTTLRQSVEDDDDHSFAQLLARTIGQSLRDNNIPKPPADPQHG